MGLFFLFGEPPLELATELDALNEVLGATGELPVNSLDSGLPDAALALRMLRSVSRATQARGWWFNREKGYKLTPDVDGNITVPSALDLIPSRSEWGRTLVLRGTRLYDAEEQTYTFADPVTADIVWGLGWTDLPDAAREFITIRAARKYQDASRTSQVMHKFHAQDEASSWGLLQHTHTRNLRANMNTGSHSVAKIVDRSFNP